MSDVEHGILSCASEDEDTFLRGEENEILKEIYSDNPKVNTRSSATDPNHSQINTGSNTGKSKVNTPAPGRVIKGTTMKRKLPSDKGGSKPKAPKKAKKNSLNSSNDIETLKSQLGLDTLFSTVSSLAGMLKTMQPHDKPTKVATSTSTLTPSTVTTRSSVPRTLTRPTASTTVNRPVSDTSEAGNASQPTPEFHGGNSEYYPFVSMPECDNYDYNDFRLDYLDNTPDESTGGVDPQLAFQNAFEDISDAGSVSQAPIGHITPELPSSEMNRNDEFMWDMPQLNTEEKTGPKIGSGLAFAVNKALTVKCDKDSISNIAKKYLRPENTSFLCAPKCNQDIWNPLESSAHSKDLGLQEIQKFMASGLIPIVNMADSLARKKDLNTDSTRHELTNAISLLGHAFFLLSSKRRQTVRPYLNDRYAKICSNETPITNQLFGDNCLSKLKELGDITKIPIAKPFYRSNFHGRNNNFQGGNLNYKGPALGRGGQGYRGRFTKRNNQPTQVRQVIDRRPRPLPPMSYPQNYQNKNQNRRF